MFIINKYIYDSLFDKNKFFDYCKNGNFYLASLLMFDTTLINKKNQNGFNGFMLACHHGHFDIVKLFLESTTFEGLNEKNICFKIGYTTLDIDGNNGFMSACAKGYYDIAKLILNDERFKGLNEKNNAGYNAFMLACCNRNAHEIVKILLNHPKFSDINVTTNKNMNGFMLACAHGNYQTVKLILTSKYYIDVNNINYNKYDALMLAILYDYKDIVGEIMKYKKTSKSKILNNIIDLYRTCMFIQECFLTI